MEDVYELRWVGWNNANTKGTKHDKVWGWLEMRDGRLYNFWGARGKTLRFKLHDDWYTLTQLQNTKARKGYNFVDPKDYDLLVKEFVVDVEFYCMNAILGDTVM